MQIVWLNLDESSVEELDRGDKDRVIEIDKDG